VPVVRMDPLRPLILTTITMDPLLRLMEGRPLITILMDLLRLILDLLLTIIMDPLHLILDLLLLLHTIILMESMV